MLFFAIYYLLSLCAYACPDCRSFTMPSLLYLGVDLSLRIAALCELESAGYLSLVNKQVCKAVTPVLPALCDVRALRRVLPFQGVSQGE